jgi:serine/threonine kinase PknH
MARIFVCYSLVDKEKAKNFCELLPKIIPKIDVFRDDEISGGEKWWKEILQEIAKCDIFVYLLSHESVTAPYCQAEFEEARRLQKRIIAVQIRGQTDTREVQGVRYVDMSTGLDNAVASVKLARTIEEELKKARKKRARWKPPPSVPPIPIETNRVADGNTPTVKPPAPEKD